MRQSNKPQVHLVICGEVDTAFPEEPLLGVHGAVGAVNEGTKALGVRSGASGSTGRAHIAAQERAHHIPALILQPVGAEDSLRLPIVLAEAAKHLRRGRLAGRRGRGARRLLHALLRLGRSCSGGLGEAWRGFDDTLRRGGVLVRYH